MNNRLQIQEKVVNLAAFVCHMLYDFRVVPEFIRVTVALSNVQYL